MIEDGADQTRSGPNPDELPFEPPRLVPLGRLQDLTLGDGLMITDGALFGS